VWARGKGEGGRGGGGGRGRGGHCGCKHVAGEAIISIYEGGEGGKGRERGGGGGTVDVSRGGLRG
jgi:hypothetical protein